MEIRIRATGAVVYENEFRAMFPNTGFPVQLTAEIINDFGGDVVLYGPYPTPGRYQIVFRDGIEQRDGQWFTKYSVADMEQDAKDALDAQQARNLRQQRDQELAKSDWRVIKALESNTPQDFEWAAYRQALRDITAHPDFPWTDLPKAPGAQ